VLFLARGRWFLTSDVASCVCLLLVLSANDKDHVRVHIVYALKWSVVSFEDHIKSVKGLKPKDGAGASGPMPSRNNHLQVMIRHR
jgi:hypothetical protein